MKKIAALLLTAGISLSLGYLKCMYDIAKQNPGQTVTVKFGRLSSLSMTKIIKNKKGSDLK